MRLRRENAPTVTLIVSFADLVPLSTKDLLLSPQSAIDAPEESPPEPDQIEVAPTQAVPFLVPTSPRLILGELVPVQREDKASPAPLPLRNGGIVCRSHFKRNA